MTPAARRPVLIHNPAQGIGLSPAPSTPRGWPLFRLGLRPFYLGAAAFAALAIPFWVATLLGQLTPQLGLPPLLWHAHEMLFGFAGAVIVGFVLTAGQAWTGATTARGGLLASLALLWLAARLGALAVPTLPYAVYALLDTLLLPWVAVILIRVLLRTGKRRNLPIGALLVLMAAANLAFHMAMLGLPGLEPLMALHAGLALIVMIECVMAGRVIPAFTAAALPGPQLAPPPWLERMCLGLTAASLAAWALLPAQWLTAAGLAAAALLHGVRLAWWQPWRTRARPILWVLHLAYAWLPMGLALLAAGQLGWLGESAGIHALAAGLTGGLIIGMLSRTARGHTGRPLQASRLEVLAYGLISVSAVVRVLLPLVLPMAWSSWIVIAALAWSAGFAAYLWRFAPWLMSARLDGRDG